MERAKRKLGSALAALRPPFQVEPGEVGRGVNSAGLAFAIALAVERPKARGLVKWARLGGRVRRGERW